MYFFNETAEVFPQSFQGSVCQCEAGKLRVKALGSVWNAILENPRSESLLAQGQVVHVLGRKGLRLIVSLCETSVD